MSIAHTSLAASSYRIDEVQQKAGMINSSEEENASRKCNYPVWRLLICFHLPKWDLLMQITHFKWTTKDWAELLMHCLVDWELWMDERKQMKCAIFLLNEVWLLNFASQLICIKYCTTLMQLYDNYKLDLGEIAYGLQITNNLVELTKWVLVMIQNSFSRRRKIAFNRRNLIGFLMA